MKVLKTILLHAGVVCSFICIAAKILDWYNPFMDFSGHIAVIQALLYLSVFLSALMEAVSRAPQKTMHSKLGW